MSRTGNPDIDGMLSWEGFVDKDEKIHNLQVQGTPAFMRERNAPFPFLLTTRMYLMYD
jgi:hypothetical protein